MEAGELALYMFFACGFLTLMEHPASPVRLAISSSMLRRTLLGLAMGATITAIILTPWGKQTGGHLNPAITFTFYRLGKVELRDALYYAAAQFAGASGGVAVAALVMRDAPRDAAVRYAATAPGLFGSGGAFAGELTISFILMTVILVVTNRDALARYAPYFVGALFAVYIALESPLSGMSMNPARTFGSALYSGYWRAIWIYFAAPALGMLAAAEFYLRASGGAGPYCAKLHHANDKRCLFHHGYGDAQPLFAADHEGCART
jgi:aquaporin Z